MAVFVVDRRQVPLMPCSEKRARLLLVRGRARVHRMIPFTIRLIDREVEQSSLQPLELKIDPGSKTTGLALVRNSNTVNAETGEVITTTNVLNLFELIHRGLQINQALTARSQMRRRRRSANLRYREPRFLNRKNKGKGWLAPSLQHRIDTTLSWVVRLRNVAPITHLAQELVRFDMQKIENPEISGAEYQQGELAGYLTRQKRLQGFQTGDMVKAIVTKGKKIGTYIGRVAVRASGSFNIQTAECIVQGINHRYCTLIQRSDGYGYSLRSDSY